MEAAVPSKNESRATPGNSPIAKMKLKKKKYACICVIKNIRGTDTEVDLLEMPKFLRKIAITMELEE